MRARPVGITDTTLRDGHQSLWATRMHTSEMIPILELMDSIGFHSLECWGGATFDACAAVPRRGPVGAPAAHQEARGAHAAADAAARPEPRGLPPLRRRHRAPVRRTRRRRTAWTSSVCSTPSTTSATTRRRPLPSRRRGKHFQGAVVLHDLAGALARPLRGRRAQARRHGRRLHLHQGHGGAALAVLRRAARRPPQGRAQRAHPVALPLHRRPRPDDLPQGHRGRRGRDRHGHRPARVRQLAAGHRDGRLRAHRHALRQRPRPREAVRDGQVLREGPPGRRLGPRRHVAHAHAGVLAPGAGRHDQQPGEPAQGAGRARPPARGARGDPDRARRGRVPAAGHADEPDRRHPGGAQRALRPSLAHRARRDEAVPARQVRRRSRARSRRRSSRACWRARSPSACARPTSSTRRSRTTARRSASWRAPRRTCSATRCSRRPRASTWSGTTSAPSRTCSRCTATCTRSRAAPCSRRAPTASRTSSA